MRDEHILNLFQTVMEKIDLATKVIVKEIQEVKTSQRASQKRERKTLKEVKE